MTRYSLLVLTNPVEGREDEYNEWYTEQHLQDVVDIPDIVSAQRFRLAPLQRATEPSPYHYYAIYEIETEDLGRVVAELQTRSGTAAMPLSDAMAAERYAYFFEPMSPLVTRRTASE